MQMIILHAFACLVQQSVRPLFRFARLIYLSCLTRADNPMNPDAQGRQRETQSLFLAMVTHLSN
jgi:hypothetical protein